MDKVNWSIGETFYYIENSCEIVKSAEIIDISEKNLYSTNCGTYSVSHSKSEAYKTEEEANQVLFEIKSAKDKQDLIKAEMENSLAVIQVEFDKAMSELLAISHHDNFKMKDKTFLSLRSRYNPELKYYIVLKENAEMVINVLKENNGSVETLQKNLYYPI